MRMHVCLCVVWALDLVIHIPHEHLKSHSKKTLNICTRTYASVYVCMCTVKACIHRCCMHESMDIAEHIWNLCINVYAYMYACTRHGCPHASVYLGCLVDNTNYSTHMVHTNYPVHNSYTAPAQRKRPRHMYVLVWYTCMYVHTYVGIPGPQVARITQDTASACAEMTHMWRWTASIGH